MDLETRKKISRTMKGHSNFEGKKHTHASKVAIAFSQEGHRNAKDHKWATNKNTGQETRVKPGQDVPKSSRWGRTRAFVQWIHAKEEKEVWEKPSPNKTPTKLSGLMKARAKARARAAGRSYPNMVDNIWAARNEDVEIKEQSITEAKATYCGRCNTTHVAPKFGGKCPALKEQQEAGQNRIKNIISVIKKLK